MTDWWLGPVKGGTPVNISKSTHPRLYWSERASITSPVACSGLMYSGVPMAMPARVSRADEAVDSVAVPCSSARATPKSATTAWPPLSRMFSGLISRCTTPCAWA